MTSWAATLRPAKPLTVSGRESWEVRLSSADARRLAAAANWSPSEGLVTFHTGVRASRAVGALTFIRARAAYRLFYRPSA